MSNKGRIGQIVEMERGDGEMSSFEWRIPDFLSLAGEGGDFYHSPVFGACNGVWSFEIYPKGLWRDHPSDWVTFCLWRLDDGPPQTLNVTLGIRGPEGVENKRGRRQEISIEDRACFWRNFCPRSELPEQNSRLMPGNVLILTMDMKSVVAGDNDLLKNEVAFFMEQIKTLQQRVENYELELEDHKKQISTLESEKLSVAEEYKYLLEEKLTLEKVNEQLKKEVESLMEQNKNLNEICEEQTHVISKASSELKKACMDNESHKKEMESLMEQIEILKKNVENYETISENYSKQMSTLESGIISSAEQYKCREKLTIVSDLEKAAIDDDAVEKNNNDEDHEESKNKRDVKQLSQVKSTKKISLPARHGGVIRSLKAILAGGRRADFTLKSGGGEWPVHRAILEGRSGHFDALFRGEWAERSEVRLDDVPEGFLDGVLHFAYAGEVGDLSAESACGTYAAAHRFLLRDLKSLCVEYMEERMGPEMVCGALAVAETHGGGDLKERAMECFFRESDRIVATEGWKELKEKHPAVIGELFQEFIKRERKKRRKE